MATWTVPSHLCTAPGAIVSLLWVLLAPLLFLYYPGLSSTALSPRFFPFPSLTSWPLSFSSVPSLPRFRLPILCSLPSGLPTICYESSTFPWQKRWRESNDWLLCFHLLSELGLWKGSLYLRALHRLWRYVLCCSYRKGFGLTGIFGANGKIWGSLF